MKYLTYDLISAANGWVNESGEPEPGAIHSFNAAVESYFEHLEGLQAHISKPAFQFFRFGFGDDSLHDGRLISMSIGDFTSERGKIVKSKAEFGFVDFRGLREYTFTAKDIRRAKLALQDAPFGDLYTYELTAAPEDNLNLSFLFANGTEISVDFRRLIFRRRKWLC